MRIGKCKSTIWKCKSRGLNEQGNQGRSAESYSGKLHVTSMLVNTMLQRTPHKLEVSHNKGATIESGVLYQKKSTVRGAFIVYQNKMFNKKIFEKVARDSTLNQRIQMKMYNWRDSGCEYNTDMIQIVYDIIDEVRIFDEENEQDSILGLIEMQTRKLSEDLEMK